MKIGIIGLGYVGLPLFCNLSYYFEVIGVDISLEKVNLLKLNKDPTGELNKEELKQLKKNNLNISSDFSILNECTVFIITVPTPIDSYKRPNLSAIESSVDSISKFIKKGDLIILESTVYPGATKKYITSAIEEKTKLICNKDFGVGYSPERINPGDKEHTLTNTKKIISASSNHYLNIIEKIYEKIINAGLFKATTIEVAEAAKIMENVQRDVNIAFMNEFEEILKPMQINIWEVLKAAKTKWNFLNFTPGLVGGHCIGIDPYYLIYQSENNGYTPNLIRSAREVNEKKVDIKAMNILKKLAPIKNKKLLILGVTFKPNCPDIRNSKILEIINILNNFEIDIEIYDPYISSEGLKNFKVLNSIKEINSKFDLICISVEHDYFSSSEWKLFVKNNSLEHKIILLKNI